MIQRLTDFLVTLIFIAVIGFSLFSITAAFAQVRVENISTNVLSPKGAIFSDVQVVESDDELYRKSFASFDGGGTLTVTDEQSSFPRIGITSGSTVTVESYWDTPSDAKWWDGIWNAPSARTKPSPSSVSFLVPELHQGTQLKVISAIQFGASNEVMSFSPRAEVIMKVDEPDGTVLYLAFNQAGTPETWTIKETANCVVTDGLCRGTVGRVDSIALVQEIHNECPDRVIENGFYGATPYCKVLCNDGFKWDEFFESCQPALGERNITVDSLEAELRAEIFQGAEIIDESTLLEKVDVNVAAPIPAAAEPIEDTFVVDTAVIVQEPETPDEEPVIITEQVEITPEPVSNAPAEKTTSLRDGLRASLLDRANQTKPVTEQTFAAENNGGFITDGERRRYNPPLKTRADVLESTEERQIAENTGTPSNNIRAYIKAAGTLLGFDKETPTEANLEDIYRVAGNGENLPTAIRENRLPTAGVAPFVIMGIAGFGLVALGRRKK